MGMQKVGKWVSYGSMLRTAAITVGKKSDQLIIKAAAKLASDIKRNITSGGSFAGQPFDALEQSTIDAKGSSAPLIDKGDLRNSVSSTKIKSSPITILVGIPGSAVSKGGGSVSEYARAHEFGAIIKKGKNSGQIIKKRAFIGPTVEKTRGIRLKEIEDDFKKIFAF